jgi:hypothetical protein
MSRLDKKTLSPSLDLSSLVHASRRFFVEAAALEPELLLLPDRVEVKFVTSSKGTTLSLSLVCSHPDNVTEHPRSNRGGTNAPLTSGFGSGVFWLSK